MEGSDNSSNIISNTIESILADHNFALEKGQAIAKKSHGNRRELEVALTVLLVDLASCDESFDLPEYTAIMNGLKRIFGTSKQEVQKLVNQAKLTLSGYQGTAQFGKTLKENLSDEDKLIILEVINQIIGADGREDGFETYFRHKIADMIGIELPSTTT